ncbi:hypothetical protein SCAR479_12649 [Seiridium cardinale]|uniref:Uncharacterized protein n=1 Tax=Seiridium cardinale TaxID=138064 RepID=A0ABR2XA84_9PEZI
MDFNSYHGCAFSICTSALMFWAFRSLNVPPQPQPDVLNPENDAVGLPVKRQNRASWEGIHGNEVTPRDIAPKGFRFITLRCRLLIKYLSDGYVKARGKLVPEEDESV